MKSIIKNVKQTIVEIGQVLLGRDASDHTTRHLVKGTSGTFGLNVLVNITLFITSIVLARLLGATGYGTYMYAIVWATLLSVPAGMGMGRILIRNVASYQAQSAWSLISGQLRWANRVVLAASLIIVILAIVTIWLLRAHIDTETIHSLWLAVIILPATTLMRLRQSTMQGLHRVIIGQLPEALVQPLILIVLVGISYFLLEEYINALWVIGLNVIATSMAFLVSIYLLYKIVPHKIKHAEPVYDNQTWLRSGLAMMLMTALNIINSRADILMLGAMTNSESVGIYNIAVRGGELITFLMIAVHASLGPTIAKLYTNKDIERLQRVITKSTRIVFSLSLPVGLGLIFFGYWFLLIFGPDFTQGKYALAILSAGQIFNVFMGPVALILIMTHHERDAAIGLGISAILNITLNALLIPQWGLEGAATATAVSMVLWNILMAMMIYRKIRIYSVAI